MTDFMTELNMREVALQGIRDLLAGLERETGRMGVLQEREIKFSTRDLMCEAYGYGRGSILGAYSLREIAQDLEMCGGAGVTWLREKSDDEVLVFLFRCRGLMRRNRVR